MTSSRGKKYNEVKFSSHYRSHDWGIVSMVTYLTLIDEFIDLDVHGVELVFTFTVFSLYLR